jgi:hypothetical protein
MAKLILITQENMKPLVYVFCVVSYINLHGQTATETDYSTGWKPVEKNSIVLYANGDIEPGVKLIKKELGVLKYSSEHVSGKVLKFHNVNALDSIGTGLDISITVFSNIDKHIITVTCFDRNSKDMLNQGTKSRRVLNAYFTERLVLMK